MPLCDLIPSGLQQYTCAILQKAKSIKEFGNIIKYAYNIFNTKFDSNKKQESLQMLQETLKYGSIDKRFNLKNATKIDKNENNKNRTKIFIQNYKHKS